METPIQSKICDCCGNAFTPHKKSINIQRFCDTTCRSYSYRKFNLSGVTRQNVVSVMRRRRVCRRCSTRIPQSRYSTGSSFCSDNCARLQYRERLQKAGKEKNRKLREEVFKKLGGAKCTYCGCDVLGALEVNHINGGGSREATQTGRSGLTMYREIVTGRRSSNDLEVACRVCNAWHYITRKTGVDNWSIKWNK